MFVDPLYYVHAIVDESTVLAYSVTSRKVSFRVAIPPPGGGDYSASDKPLSGKLGKTPFASIIDHPSSAWASRGARRIGYGEEQYLANPGNYQSLMLMVNDAAPWRGGWTCLTAVFNQPHDMERSWAESEVQADEVLHALRTGLAPNTFVLTAPNTAFEDLRMVGLSVDLDLVRVIPWRPNLLQRLARSVARRRFRRIQAKAAHRRHGGGEGDG